MRSMKETESDATGRRDLSLGSCDERFVSECGLRECVQQNHVAFHQTLLVFKDPAAVERRWHDRTKANEGGSRGMAAKEWQVYRYRATTIARKDASARTSMQTLRIAHTHYRLDLSWWRTVSWAQVTPRRRGAQPRTLRFQPCQPVGDDRLGSKQLKRGPGTHPATLFLSCTRNRRLESRNTTLLHRRILTQLSWTSRKELPLNSGHLSAVLVSVGKLVTALSSWFHF
jgi:hypothetical protein